MSLLINKNATSTSCKKASDTVSVTYVEKYMLVCLSLSVKQSAKNCRGVGVCIFLLIDAFNLRHDDV